MTVTISAFYKFVAIADAPALRDRLRDEMAAWYAGGERPDAVDGLRGSWLGVIGTQGGRGR